MADPQAPLNPDNGLNKMYAAGGASVIAGALTTVVVAIINGIDPSYHMTDTLQGAIETLVTTGLAMGAVYLTPHGRS
jgi:hypothetical protein